MIGLGSLAAIRAGEANVAAAAGDGDIPAVGVDSDHAGVRHGAAHECCDQPCEFASRDWNLQSLLLICERVGCAVVLGTGDRGGFGDCMRVAAGIRLGEAGCSAILSVFRGAADVSANCNYPADADDRSVTDSFHRGHAGDDDAASRATPAGRIADFGGRDWLVWNFLAHTLCRAALDRALGSGGARGCANCGQRRDRDWQQCFVLFFSYVFHAVHQSDDERILRGFLACVRAGVEHLHAAAVD
jgi:hypothetical protein